MLSQNNIMIMSNPKFEGFVKPRKDGCLIRVGMLMKVRA